jgi:hypothetical protein
MKYRWVSMAELYRMGFSKATIKSIAFRAINSGQARIRSDGIYLFKHYTCKAVSVHVKMGAPNA